MKNVSVAKDDNATNFCLRREKEPLLSCTEFTEYIWSLWTDISLLLLSILKRMYMPVSIFCLCSIHQSSWFDVRRYAGSGTGHSKEVSCQCSCVWNFAGM
jgi:hypothetical protein